MEMIARLVLALTVIFASAEAAYMGGMNGGGYGMNGGGIGGGMGPYENMGKPHNRGLLGDIFNRFRPKSVYPYGMQSSAMMNQPGGMMNNSYGMSNGGMPNYYGGGSGMNNPGMMMQPGMQGNGGMDSGMMQSPYGMSGMNPYGRGMMQPGMMNNGGMLQTPYGMQNMNPHGQEMMHGMQPGMMNGRHNGDMMNQYGRM